MLQSKLSTATITKIKAMTDLSQVKSQLKADSGNIFLRILIAMKLANASQVAQKLGIAKQSVYEWRENTPSVESLMLIAKSANASLHWLLTGEGEVYVSRGGQVDLNDVFEEKMRLIAREELEDQVRFIIREELNKKTGALSFTIGQQLKEEKENKAA